MKFVEGVVGTVLGQGRVVDVPSAKDVLLGKRRFMKLLVQGLLDFMCHKVCEGHLQFGVLHPPPDLTGEYGHGVGCSGRSEGMGLLHVHGHCRPAQIDVGHLRCKVHMHVYVSKASHVGLVWL